MDLLEEDQFDLMGSPPLILGEEEKDGVQGGVIIITERGGDFAEGPKGKLDFLEVKKEEGSSGGDSFDQLSFLSHQFQ